MGYANGGSIAFPHFPGNVETLFPGGGGGVVVGGGGAFGHQGGAPHGPGVCFKIEPEPGSKRGKAGTIVELRLRRGGERLARRRRSRPPSSLRVCTAAGREVHVCRSQIKTCQQA